MWAGVALLVAACGPAVGTTGTDGDEGSSTAMEPTSTTSSVPPNPSTTTPPSTVTTTPTTATTVGTSGSGGDESSGDVTTGVGACIGEDCPVDIVVVVDNSRGLGGAQRTLARAMVDLERQLRDMGADAQVMFTTTDMGNISCTPFRPDGYDPASGAPVTTACVERISDFTGLGGNPEVVPEACTDVCAEAIAPTDDPFVAFGPGGVNVEDGRIDFDVDGDGRPDSAAARAMACMAPMGVNGCGFESPLEAMLQALNPNAAWNQGDRPFMRDDASLGIVLLTDEYDCSVSNSAIMNDPTFFEINPASGTPAASSALCWNASVDCTQVGGGEYDCVANDEDRLHPLERYRSYLVDFVSAKLNKPVFMAGIVGIPAVTEHLDRAPFTPLAGGIDDLVLRDWTEADVLPDEAAAGVTAADKQFNFGIGPGCTNAGSSGHAQGLPPVRTAALCQTIADEQGADACCLESICDDDYGAAMRCLFGMFQLTQD